MVFITVWRRPIHDEMWSVPIVSSPEYLASGLFAVEGGYAMKRNIFVSALAAVVAFSMIGGGGRHMRHRSPQGQAIHLPFYLRQP